MRYYIPVTLALLAGGCGSTQGQLLLDQLGDRAAAEADAALNVAVWSICKAPTAGALTRRWGSNPAAFRQWAEFCDYVTFPIGGGS